MTASRRSLEYDPGIAWWKLPNQLTVVVMPETRANLVAVDVRYEVGAAEDPPGKTGLAHLVEHMMFARRAEPGGASFADRLSRATLRFNASTRWDETHYTALGLAARLDELLAIEAERMSIGCEGLDEATLVRERAVVLQELSQRTTAAAFGQVEAVAFGPGHPYGHNHGIGGGDVATVTRDDVCRFIEAHYVPARAVLVVTGRIPTTVVRDIKARFGAIAARPSRAQDPVQPIAWSGQVSDLPIMLDDSAVVVAFPAAPWGSKEWIYDNLVDRIILQRLSREAVREPWILGLFVVPLGGKRGGARGFVLELSDPQRADDAIAKVYAALPDLPGRFDDDLILALASARQSELLDAFESIDTRGTSCADLVQFTTHGRFQLRELTELTHLDYGLLRTRGERLSRAVSRVVRLLPAREPGAAIHGALSASTAIDLPVWRAPVDPAEAERPIVLPRDTRASALRERRLPNGLRVVMQPSFKQPVFEARLVFPVGGNTTGGGKRGIALAAAYLLWHDLGGWFTSKERDLVSWVLRIGAPVSPDVTDHTTFRVHGSSMFADGHLWRLHWLLANGVFDKLDMEHMQDRVERAATRRDRQRAGRRALRAALFGRDHPYADDTAATLADNVKSLRPPDLERFRDAYYRANGASLVLVGSFDPDAMTRQVNELFGAWRSEPPPPLDPIPPMRPAAGPSWIADIDPDAVQVRVTYAFAATSARTARAARSVVREMLRDRVEEVRARLGASYGVQVRYRLGDAGDVLEIEGLVDAGRAGEVVRALEADLRGLRTGDNTFAADFVRARRSALFGALGDPVRSSSAADRIEEAIAEHLPIDAVESLPAEIAATTIEAVRKVIAEDLQPARTVVMLGGRQRPISAAFAATGVTGFQTVTEEPAVARSAARGAR